MKPPNPFGHLPWKKSRVKSSSLLQLVPSYKGKKTSRKKKLGGTKNEAAVNK